MTFDERIACTLDALSPAEQIRRSKLAYMIKDRSAAHAQTETGYRIELPNDAETLQSVVDFVHLEGRCCPFLELSLEFHPGDQGAVLVVGGGSGVKRFLSDTGVFGCAELRPHLEGPER